MPVAASARRRSPLNYWPGFVDALSTLLLSIVFLLSVFMLAQFFLAREITTQETALERLNRQITELTDLLALERSNRRTVEETVTGLQTTLRASEADRSRLQGMLESGSAADQKASQLGAALESEKQATARAALPGRAPEPADRGDAPPARRPRGGARRLRDRATRRARPASPTSAAGSTSRWRSASRSSPATAPTSSAACAQILGNRTDVRIVGDRFVFQSELFFERGQAILKPEAMPELDRIAALLVELEKQIPPDIPWVLRVDGHTDVRPIATLQFPSNWALSASRAIAVVQYLIQKGIPPQRLVAAGFGEFQPLDPATTDDAYARNRRIELKLTER